ncbi:hypothetical protein QW060_13735 [Myroides ceti]|uniref:Uncharacterized protein n=1 Tax=Paenimyroides ceti TaxID=395087 RepID=A0ABT8CUI6_9FLAO|nr:hypothetical protein [Paenimyroides ceti]MDN3708167.1 hypothetical protein [Paenimyroides ceti]
MKKIYLYAVAITLAFASCDVNDEQAQESMDYQSKTTSQAQVDVATLYKDLIHTYNAPAVMTNPIALASFQDHALNNAVFRSIAKEQDYNAINISEFETVLSSDTSLINTFSYRSIVKSYILRIIDGEYNLNSVITNDVNLTKDERVFLINCYLVSNSTSDGTPNNWKKSKTIAFAYGHQKSLAQAIILAGAVEILNNQI